MMPSVSALASKDMVSLPGGTFAMGSEEFYAEEGPVHAVTVDPFAIDRHPVTVREFRRFVVQTDHVTEAERAPDPAHYPDARPRAARPRLAGLPAHAPARSPSAIPTPGGATSPAPAGTRPKGPARRCAAASAIRSPTSPMATRRPTPLGRARSCRPRPSGSTPPAAGWTASASPGARRSRPTAR